MPNSVASEQRKARGHNFHRIFSFRSGLIWRVNQSCLTIFITMQSLAGLYPLDVAFIFTGVGSIILSIFQRACSSNVVHDNGEDVTTEDLKIMSYQQSNKMASYLGILSDRSSESKL